MKTSKWSVLAIVAIGVFMATLDASIVNISLPKISLYFRVPLGGMVEWVIIAYLIVISSILLTLGRLSDMIGRKVIWVFGLAVFTASSVLCGVAPSLLFLVVSRAIQGIGGAMIMSVGPAMITHAFRAGERGRALGFLGTVVAVGTSAGPTLGGIITQAFSWRWIFYINAPIGIIGIITTIRFLSEPMRPSGAAKKFDPVGAALLSLSLVLLMLAMTFGQEIGWVSPWIMGLFAASAVLLGAFVLFERRTAYPIVDLSIFNNRLFSASLVSSFLSFLSLFAVMFLMPFYLEELLSLQPDHAGLLLTAVPLTISLVAPVSGWLSDRYGSRVLSSLGLTVASAGLFFLSRLTQSTSLSGILWPLIVAGFGQALFQSPNNNAIMSSVPENRIGTASGFLATVRVLGQGFSVAMAGAIFTSLGGAKAGAMLTRNGAHDTVALQNTFVHAFQIAILTSMIIASIGIFTSLARGHKRQD
ncbi:Drug resistance transporter, EmrB/QacA subfamily (fragment) [Syntrophobacter sp. SbD1]